MAQGKALALGSAPPQLPEEQTHAHKLRQAVAEGVTVEDINDVVGGIVKRAKGGDKTAIAHLFTHVIGPAGPQQVTMVQNNTYTEQADGQPAIDTINPPASEVATKMYDLLTTEGSLTPAIISLRVDATKEEVRKTAVDHDWFHYDNKQVHIAKT